VWLRPHLFGVVDSSQYVAREAGTAIDGDGSVVHSIKLSCLRYDIMYYFNLEEVRYDDGGLLDTAVLSAKC